MERPRLGLGHDLLGEPGHTLQYPAQVRATYVKNQIGHAQVTVSLDVQGYLLRLTGEPAAFAPSGPLGVVKWSLQGNPYPGRVPTNAVGVTVHVRDVGREFLRFQRSRRRRTDRMPRVSMLHSASDGGLLCPPTQIGG